MPHISRRNLLAGLALSSVVNPLRQASESRAGRDESGHLDLRTILIDYLPPKHNA